MAQEAGCLLASARPNTAKRLIRGSAEDWEEWDMTVASWAPVTEGQRSRPDTEQGCAVLGHRCSGASSAFSLYLPPARPRDCENKHVIFLWDTGSRPASQAWTSP
jgi:hypothetical protein